jgi:UDP-GlcNAc3NAcA epimerase
MKLVNIVGARPQIIKAAAVSRAIVKHNKKHPARPIIEIIVHTGQHYDRNMSQVFFEELDVPKPDYNLGVGSASHGEQTGKMLQRIEAVLVKEKPDYCLVYGDTNSTVAGALAAAKLHIPVAHIEAGLRSFNRAMPEEVNRVVTDHVSALLFCPTQTSVDNLAMEGILAGVHQVGDVMYDCILFYAKKTKSVDREILKRLGIGSKSYYLATVHRAENTDDGARLAYIFKAFNEIADEECPVVLPLHPRTVKYAHKNSLKFTNCVKVVQPVSYMEMVALENNARLILTDSGGVQKEAYWLSVPCVTLRDETEWVETLESGWNILAGADKGRIINAVRNGHKPRRVKPQSIYGNGTAANQICNILSRSQKKAKNIVLSKRVLR